MMSSNKDFFSAVVDVGAPHNLGFWWDGYKRKKDELKPANIKARSIRQNKEALRELVENIAQACMVEKRIALGLECPLWIPLAENFEDYSTPRLVDYPAQKDHPQYLRYTEQDPIKNPLLPHSLPWSAGAGACVSMMGIAFIAKLFRDLLAEIELKSDKKKMLPRLVTNPQDWETGDILIWEAFVSGNGETIENKEEKSENIVSEEKDGTENAGEASEHDNDAKKAGEAFSIIESQSDWQTTNGAPAPAFFIKCEGQPIIYPDPQASKSRQAKGTFISLLEPALRAAGWSLDNNNYIHNRLPLAIRLEK